jgi:soluble lytic murein transglycosylase-like protein
MIKLFRTHPGHLAGDKIPSSSSPGLAVRRIQESLSFGKILEKTVGRLTNSINVAKRTTVLSKNISSRLRSAHLIRPYDRIFPALSTGQTGTVGGVDSVSKPPRDAEGFDPLIEEASHTFGVKKDLIRAVIKAESDFQPTAKSKSGAVGLMQLLPSTGRDLGVTNLYDPRENIFGGTRYLAMLLDRYSGNLELTLAAYNWGPGNLGRAPDRLPRETKEYVQKVLRYLESHSA